MQQFALEPNESNLQDALQTLKSGGVVAYPSGTVWGLAVLPPYAELLSQRKKRPSAKPFQLSCASIQEAQKLVQVTPEWLALASLWPAGLTLVTTASVAVNTLTPDDDAQTVFMYPSEHAHQNKHRKVGIRVPEHPTALALLQKTGPLVTSSLNPSGFPAATTLTQAQQYVRCATEATPDLADYLLYLEQHQEFTSANSTLASTVVEIARSQHTHHIRILRQGAISSERLRETLEQHGLFTQVTRA